MTRLNVFANCSSTYLRAFVKYLEENEHKCLDSLDFSPKQLFWIAQAQDWCLMGFDYDTDFQEYEVNSLGLPTLD